MINIDSKKYVVLDVETNGLSSLNNDLLSISLYKPDDEKSYNRFLPLELEETVWTDAYLINGIEDEMLKDKLPLTQEEFDSIVKDFELDKRIILHYGNIDEKFIKNYLKRKRIKGFDKLNFYNFKHDIISSKYSEGNITKDNLCTLYGIDNVNKVHSGLNDCILEWKLFKKMNGNRLIVIDNEVYEFNDDYIIPASYLQDFTNFKYHINNFPQVSYKMEEIKKIRIESKDIKKFENNISGITIEHLINIMLEVEDKSKESDSFIIANRNKLNKLGELPSNVHELQVVMNNDGTISAVNNNDRKIVKDINETTNAIKKEIGPLIEFIKKDIFEEEPIMSQELVVNREENVLARCDLSTSTKILEIKSYGVNPERTKYQLYYEAKGREIYILHMLWHAIQENGIIFVIYKVTANEQLKKERDISKINRKAKERFERKLNNKTIDVIRYVNKSSDIVVKCKMCGKEWSTTYNKLINKPYCINCDVDEVKDNKLASYQKKLKDLSGDTLLITSYYGEKEKLTAMCINCNYRWKIRADLLLKNPCCPKCNR